MEEVLKFIEDYSKLELTDEDECLSMIKATGEFFKYISNKIELDERPNYKELFESFKSKN
jgi:cell fate (sporulation/competence/biofilm development) regulator YlbF (YheA/YmcA/DUF963 family)